MREQEFYPEICERLAKHFAFYIDDDVHFAYAYDQTLDCLVNEIENQLSCSSSNFSSYIPRLNLDILFGFKKSGLADVSYLLIEVKYLERLSLKDFSQLLGYLQVSKNISTGLLLLVTKNFSPNRLTDNLSLLIRTKYLPLQWELVLENVSHHFNAGLCFYIPKDDVYWIDTSSVNGISSFQDCLHIVLS